MCEYALVYHTSLPALESTRKAGEYEASIIIHHDHPAGLSPCSGIDLYIS